MKEDYEVEEKKQAASDVLDQYSKFVMACIGNKVRPCDLRLHLMKEISGLPTSLKRETHHSSGNSEAMGVSGVGWTMMSMAGHQGVVTGKKTGWLQMFEDEILQIGDLLININSLLDHNLEVRLFTTDEKDSSGYNIQG